MSKLKRIIIFICIISNIAFAQDEEQIKSIVLEYKKGMDQHKVDLIKKSSTEKYYKTLSKNDLLKRLFKKNKLKENAKYNVEIIKSKVIKDYILANLKEINNEHTETYKIIKTDQGYRIDSIIHLDE
jgi:hypothetical protein